MTAFPGVICPYLEEVGFCFITQIFKTITNCAATKNVFSYCRVQFYGYVSGIVLNHKRLVEHFTFKAC